MIGMKYLDEHLQRSKYFQKHYTVEEYDGYPVDCPRCKGIFEVDFKWTKSCTDIEHEGFVRITCPYCSNKFRYHV